MGISIANAHAKNAVLFNHGHDFVMCCDFSFTLHIQKSQYTRPVSETAQRKFAYNRWMAKQKVISDNLNKLIIAAAEMVNPN
ncbi:hypothetical protein CEV34_3710 [Brucella pseudogrignonensis]|uniref:Uncharacterized protein n=1 Tax=Brucella pseudogrignonensis TaxID=419475 RepID=A0A256G9T9_9HYPH|nr:hypothetical protein CEV34_3710 [Brucella pseudogrignonensis]